MVRFRSSLFWTSSVSARPGNRPRAVAPTRPSCAQTRLSRGWSWVSSGLSGGAGSRGGWPTPCLGCGRHPVPWPKLQTSPPPCLARVWAGLVPWGDPLAAPPGPRVVHKDGHPPHRPADSAQVKADGRGCGQVDAGQQSVLQGAECREVCEVLCGGQEEAKPRGPCHLQGVQDHVRRPVLAEGQVHEDDPWKVCRHIGCLSQGPQALGPRL